MKKFLAAAAVLVVTSVHAEELKFGDLNYFLKQGQINVGADAIMNNEPSRNGAVDNEVDGYLFETHAGYALNDSLNFTLGLNYLFDGMTKIGKNSSNTNDDGFQNPKFGANYRVLNQNDFGVNFDVGAVASVKLIDREVGSANKDGNSINPILTNYGEPRNTLDVNARLGKKWNEANEFYFTGGVAYHMDGSYKQLEGETVDMDASLDFKLSAFYQYRPVNEFMMTLGIASIRVGEMDGNNGVTNTTKTSHIDHQVVFNAKFLVNESLIVKFITTQDNRSNFDVTKDVGATETYSKRHALQYGLGLDFIF
jgi:hypothetical protein